MSSISISNFKFGIELEANVSETYMGQVARKGWIHHYEHCGAELKSPPLVGYAGLLEVRRQIKNIWSNASKIYFSECGLHVHVDIQDFTLLNLKRLMVLMSKNDDVMFSIMDSTRNNNTYCRRMYGKKEGDIWSANSLSQVQELSNVRYYALNTYAFSKHGTIEFRYCHGTLDWRIIYSIISFYLHIVAFAKTEIQISSKDNIDFFVKKVVQDPPSADDEQRLKEKRSELFDLIQFKGPTRLIVEEMSDKNMSDIKFHKPKSDMFELRDNMRFSIKG